MVSWNVDGRGEVKEDMLSELDAYSEGE